MIMHLVVSEATDASLNLKCKENETIIKNDLLKLSGLLDQLRTINGGKLIEDTHSSIMKFFGKCRSR